VCLLAESPPNDSDDQADEGRPRSLKATIALFADPPADPEVPQRSNDY